MTKKLNKILYVEDELDISTIALIALQDIGGFDVKACSNGYDAITVAPSFKPDLLLLDVMLPDIDGLETLKELRKLPETKETPVIFMTAKIQTKEIEEYYKLGAIHVITKPFDPMQLADMILASWNKYYG